MAMLMKRGVTIKLTTVNGDGVLSSLEVEEDIISDTSVLSSPCKKVLVCFNSMMALDRKDTDGRTHTCTHTTNTKIC